MYWVKTIKIGWTEHWPKLNLGCQSQSHQVDQMFWYQTGADLHLEKKQHLDLQKIDFWTMALVFQSRLSLTRLISLCRLCLLRGLIALTLASAGLHEPVSIIFLPSKKWNWKSAEREILTFRLLSKFPFEPLSEGALFASVLIRRVNKPYDALEELASAWTSAVGSRISKK